MKDKKKIKPKVNKDAVGRSFPLLVVVILLFVVLVGAMVLSKSSPPLDVKPTVTAESYSLLASPTLPPTSIKTATPFYMAFPTATPLPLFKTATPFLPFADMAATPNVQYIVMTMLEISNRNGKLVSVRDVPGMYYPGTSTPSKVIGQLLPSTSWYVEQAYMVQEGAWVNVWARLASQDGFIPLLYNDIYYTNWRKPP